MGVWHFTGLGLSPGAITVPLTYVYLILKAARLGDINAKRFFETSGERNQNGDGTPEALIIFTSEEVITGRKGSSFIDNWFQIGGNQNVPIAIAKYIKTLLNKLVDENFKIYDEGIRYIYFVKVNHEDYHDCFFKVYITLKGLRDKEIWINMIGGTNQINSALLTASGLTGVSARYYYFFQKFEDTKFLHPNIEKPNFKNPKIEIPPKSWYELPVFWLETADLIKELNLVFEGERRVNIGEIRGLLNRLQIPEQFLIKLLGSRLIKRIEENLFTKGEMLEIWNRGIERAEKESESVVNFSEWKKWASKEGILWKLTLDGKCKQVET
jgi:hypothetical protein